MANPQPTPFVRFSKELFEAFYLNPPGNMAAGAIWLWVMRWTWADFEKEETPAKSIRAIAEELGMDKSTVHRELESLVRGRRLKPGEKGGYAIQKDYDLWRKDGWRKPRGSQKGAQISLGLALNTVPTVGTNLSPRWGQIVPRVGTNRPQGGDKPVPTVGTAIRSKNTIENKEGAKAAPKSKNIPQLPNNKRDTARNRAELGSLDFPPEDAPDFAKLTFKIKDELNDAWKEAAARSKRGGLQRCRQCREDGRYETVLLRDGVTPCCPKCREREDVAAS